MKTEITRSQRRKSSVTARLTGDTLLVMAPSDMPNAELQAIIVKLSDRLTKRRNRRELNAVDGLMKRAQELNRTYFDGRLHITSVEYVTNQNSRFGSCSPRTQSIRINHRLAKVPAWVRDYVLVHELAHLLHPNHGRRFWAQVRKYALAERARGYLMAMGMEAVSEESAGEDETPPAGEIEE
jgi:hypothetical protein